MEMPNFGERIIILTSSGYVEDVSGTVIQGVEAVPVQPHGRLIDADALKDLYNYNAHDSDIDKAWTGNIRRSIDSAPTIIPAEEGE
jgi:hypothetical protein